MSATSTANSPGVLTVDLGALTRNYRLLKEAAAPGACGAVVKADAYGLGLGAVSRALHAAGCTEYFVANLEEGRRLRRLLPDVAIYVLAGPEPGDEGVLSELDLTPVLNSLPQIDRWVNGVGAGRSAVVHIDTGMSRLGLAAADVEALAQSSAKLGRLAIEYVMTHLACADEPEHPLNDRQLERFDALRALLPAARTCIGNSAALLTDTRYCGDLSRAGVALYGGNPFVSHANPMHTVVHLHSPILQVREVTDPLTVGYGATCRVDPPGRLATIGAGYADGYPRSLGNNARAVLAGVDVAVVGRVSMDLLTVDVSNVPVAELRPGAMVELLGDHVRLDELARAAGTISYELLTRLGPRWYRHYVGDSATHAELATASAQA